MREVLILISKLFLFSLVLFACGSKNTNQSGKESFEEVLNNPQVNSKKVGESEGIKYFQIEKDGKTGFRDLDGNVVIAPIYDMAEMFSEGCSAVELDKKWGLIDETGKYIVKPQFEYLGSVHNGLASFRKNDKYGFVNIKGEEKIKAQYDWVDEFSEGLCVVRNDNGVIGSGKCGYIDTTGKQVIDLQYQYACKFINGEAKIELNNLWGAIDKQGNIVVKINHKSTDW